MDDGDARFWVVRLRYAVVIHFVRYQWICELSEPKLEQRRKDMWIVKAVQSVVPLVHTELQFRDEVTVTGDPKDALCFRTT